MIPRVRNPEREFPYTRDPSALDHHICLQRPSAQYIESCNDYYLRSDDALIQYLRSPVSPDAIEAGRIAIASERRDLIAWYQSMVRWLKKHFSNRLVYASHYRPGVGYRERAVWAGPHAIEAARRGTRLLLFGPREWSLHPIDRDEDAARWRDVKRILLIGRVEEVGEIVDAQLNKRRYRLQFDDGEVKEFEGGFLAFRPEPRAGDEIACVLVENTYGRHDGEWEPGELKKLTPKNRARVLASLQNR